MTGAPWGCHIAARHLRQAPPRIERHWLHSTRLRTSGVRLFGGGNSFSNWLSDAPLDTWGGVTTDENGRVVAQIKTY